MSNLYLRLHYGHSFKYELFDTPKYKAWADSPDGKQILEDWGDRFYGQALLQATVARTRECGTIHFTIALRGLDYIYAGEMFDFPAMRLEGSDTDSYDALFESFLSDPSTPELMRNRENWSGPSIVIRVNS